MSEKVNITPAAAALYAFDAENNVEPARSIATRIAYRWTHDHTDSLIDEIAHAIEDARELGAKRAALSSTQERKP